MKKFGFLKTGLIISFLSTFFYLGVWGNDFALEFLRNPEAVGSLAPSSKALQNEITKYVEKAPAGKRILEVGAGTGAFTRRLVAIMKPGDTLEIVELQEQFCSLLRQEFGAKKGVQVHCMSILDLKPKAPYDFIVSGLPFNSFSTDLVVDVFDYYQRHLKPEGTLSYFEYLWLPTLKRVTSFSQKKKTFINLRKFLEDKVAKYAFETVPVYANITPAAVHHMRFKPL